MTEDENKMDDNAEAPEMKECPSCGEKILVQAKKCRFCGEFLNDKNESNASQNIPQPSFQHKQNASPFKSSYIPGMKNGNIRFSNAERKSTPTPYFWSAISAACGTFTISPVGIILITLKRNAIWWPIGIGLCAGLLHFIILYTLCAGEDGRTCRNIQQNSVVQNLAALFGIVLLLVVVAFLWYLEMQFKNTFGSFARGK